MAEEKTVAEEATDDALSAAWETVTEEKKTESVEDKKPEETASKAETPPEEKPASEEKPPVEEEETIDHKEASKLGRKYKGLEHKVDQILARLDQQPQVTEKPEEEEMPEVVTTPEDVERVIQAREQKSQQAKVEYERNYLKQVDSLKTANEDLHDEIVAEMIQNFNVMHDPKNPFADARVNYAEAKSAVLTKKYTSTKPKVPQRETSETPPVQPAASATRTATKPYVMPKLDKEAMDYLSDIARREKKSVEEVAKELGVE